MSSAAPPLVLSAPALQHVKNSKIKNTLFTNLIEGQLFEKNFVSVGFGLRKCFLAPGCTDGIVFEKEPKYCSFLVILTKTNQNESNHFTFQKEQT